MTSPMFEMDCLRLLATSDNIQLLATELRTRLGIRIIQPHLHAHHVGQIQIDLYDHQQMTAWSAPPCMTKVLRLGLEKAHLTWL